MLTFAVISLFMIVFAIGLALGCRANAGELQELINARRELDALRAALNATQSQSVAKLRRYERRLSSAKEALHEYEDIRNDGENPQQPKSAVILPFKK